MNALPSPAEHPYIERRPGVQGGCPVLRGTRFPVSSIVSSYRNGASVEEILEDFPHLSPAAVHDALSYYHGHTDEIDREIAEREDLEGLIQQYPPTLRPPEDLEGLIQQSPPTLRPHAGQGP